MSDFFTSQQLFSHLQKEKRHILHVDLDAFFASVEKALHPELCGKAVVVGGTNARGVVACPSYEARALGVKTAMPIQEARRIAPGATFIAGNFENYKKFSEKFFDILLTFTDEIEPRSLDEAYVDVSSIVSNTQEALKLAKKIQATLVAQLGLTASVGIARNKVCAKVASDLQKPHGTTLVQPNQERAFLAPLPIEKLPGIGMRTKQALNNLGVHSIRQLAELPESILAETFGKSGVLLSAFANGIDWRGVEKPQESKSVSKSLTLAADTMNRNVLEAEIFHLLERCTFTLRKQKRVCGTIAVTTRFADFTTYSKQKTLDMSTNLENNLWPTADQLLSTLLTVKKPVRMVSVTLDRLQRNHYQTSLFDYPFSKVKNIQYALDKIRLHFGFGAIENGKTFQRIR